MATFLTVMGWILLALLLIVLFGMGAVTALLAWWKRKDRRARGKF